jgi:hypothetical protein
MRETLKMNVMEKVSVLMAIIKKRRRIMLPLKNEKEDSNP